MSRKTPVEIPSDLRDATLRIDDVDVHVTNLQKIYFPRRRLTKRDLLQYYVDMSPVLLPHLVGRAMVMKRYPNGIRGSSFYMKRAPTSRPDWIETCAIKHGSGNVIEFAMVDGCASLVWLINLGCIDLHPWYARCDAIDRPDYLHFDLDPSTANWTRVCDVAKLIRDELEALGMRPYVKTSGSKGLHVFVPIVRGPTQTDVLHFARDVAQRLAIQHPGWVTTNYSVTSRPRGRVLIDYNQNAFGRTLASVYSVRPRESASVSCPVTWDELDAGIKIDDFRLENMRERVAARGDLWAPMAPGAKRRFELRSLLEHTSG